jgi:hypothetical protein
MKIKIITIIISLLVVSVTARMVGLFPGWDQLADQSSNIVIAHCGKPFQRTAGVIIENGPLSDSEVEVISVLKGATNQPSPARLWTDHELFQGENYLVFGYYDSGIYQAYEEFRIVPLGGNFSTNLIAGKPLNEQIQILLKRRLDNLNRQMKQEQVEKQRLE